MAQGRGRVDSIRARFRWVERLSRPPRSVEREIAATDAEIENLVYELYGITDEEWKTIDGESGPVVLTKDQGGG
jgi:hypothetical protein